MTKFGKETRHQYVFIKKQRLVNSAKCQTKAHITRSFHFHRHDVLIVPLTVLLQCPITSMTRTLSYKCSNRAGDNQSRSKFLLQFWLILIKEAQFFIGSWRKGPQRGNISLDSTQFPFDEYGLKYSLEMMFLFLCFRPCRQTTHPPKKAKILCAIAGMETKGSSGIENASVQQHWPVLDNARSSDLCRFFNYDNPRNESILCQFCE